MMLTYLTAALVAAAGVLLSGPFFIPMLHKLKFGQSIREEGPKSHQAKSGTPTMGGIMIALSAALAVVIAAKLDAEIGIALLAMLGYFVIGFVDDYIKVVLKRNLGLTAKQKLLAQILLAGVIACIGTGYLNMRTDIWIPFLNINVDFGYFYYVLLFLVLVGTTNAVNLTDGLDGLAAGAVAVAMGAYFAVCLHFGQFNLAVFCLAVAVACLAFLWFNANPARVFMGDTGSLALGGALAAAAILTKTELLLILIGGLFVVEAMSVIIQVTSFKTRGKRVFLMSPIHHHFELKGWSEIKVVAVFWTFGFLCTLLALGVLYFR